MKSFLIVMMGRKSIAIFFLLLCVASIASAQELTQKLPEKSRILFMLDASGSMYAKWENTLRITVAKKMLAQFVDSLRADENLELGLRVYGHQFDRRLHKCNDSKLEVPFSANNHDAIIQKLRLIKPKGTTPIAYSLEQAGSDFPSGDDTRNIIIIITDGIESCDGDPCAVSLALQKKGIFLKPFVIGIGMDKKFEEAFSCMGDFYDAADINAFQEALHTAVVQSLEETTVSVELLDEKNRPTETNVNVSFINNFTGISAFEFVHYRDQQGRPDSVEIDPVLNYDLVVNTVPPVVKENINLKAGQHNVLEINCPQGYVAVDLPGHSEYKDGVTALVRNVDSGEIITHFQVPDKIKLLAGRYRLEVLALPKRTFNITVAPRATRQLALQQPGVVNFIGTSRGIGSLYEISETGSQRWIMDLDQNILRNVVAIQPGNYKIVFRSIEAKGSKYTAIRPFRVVPGASMKINL
jgi:Ca-activated chloride channel family protein